MAIHFLFAEVYVTVLPIDDVDVLQFVPSLWRVNIICRNVAGFRKKFTIARSLTNKEPCIDDVRMC